MRVGMGAAFLPRGLEDPVTAVLTAQYTIETPWTEASVKRKRMPGGTGAVSVLTLAVTLVSLYHLEQDLLG